MNANRFTRRLVALVATCGLAACAAYASPPDPTPLKAFDSGQQLGKNTELIVQEFDTGQQLNIAATAVIAQKVAIDAVAYAPKELDTSPQPDIVTAALVVTPAANIDANAEPTPPLDTSPPIGGQCSINVVATIVNSAIGTVANTARIKELDTSPPATQVFVMISGALGIANLDTGQPTAGYAGYQVQALSA